MQPAVHKYILTTKRNISHIRALVRKTDTLDTQTKEEILRDLFNAQEQRPVTYEPKPKPEKKKLLPWLYILNTYLKKYGVAQTSLMLNLSERVIRCITEGSCIPTERIQKQICVQYAGDIGLSYAEVADGKFKA